MSDYYSGHLVETRLRRYVDNLEQQVESLRRQVDRLTEAYLQTYPIQDRRIALLEKESVRLQAVKKDNPYSIYDHIINHSS